MYIIRIQSVTLIYSLLLYIYPHFIFIIFVLRKTIYGYVSEDVSIGFTQFKKFITFGMCMHQHYTYDNPYYIHALSAVILICYNKFSVKQALTVKHTFFMILFCYVNKKFNFELCSKVFIFLLQHQQEKYREKISTRVKKKKNSFQMCIFFVIQFIICKFILFVRNTNLSQNAGLLLFAGFIENFAIFKYVEICIKQQKWFQNSFFRLKQDFYQYIGTKIYCSKYYISLVQYLK
eukprot:TRINITY_DN7032_c0_g1_i5.p1 TRINITY_DN7032_c0_g1~~TRINITY_DN7032_c0_g1_i5.p1  ORF type:complete len:260 (+),score=-22.39 TRINITY_DN7032_c0_g1_i5:79-780(+)